ncbi:single-stranded DNA-binding protein [Ralstonia mannitolilytica]|uniref:single-stranded DNA-binding protein n=1 Tax=Ralstonia mannitolilytica TaxID=105219 RepID=UPI0026EAEBBE|nr:single-stranded DNA-binding protein [Ralstonia mannitolilytica]
MIDVLIAGTVSNEPRERLGDDGRPRARVNLTALDGSGKVQLISCTSGNPEARRALTRLHVGDSVAISGRATLHVYQRREDATRAAILRVSVNRVLTQRGDDDFDDFE